MLQIISFPLHRLLFFLTLVLLPSQLGYHFWPEWALIAGRRVDYLSPTIFLTDILMLMTILTWFISLPKSVLRDMYQVSWKKLKTKKCLDYKSIIHDTFPIILIVIFAGINIWSAEVWQVAAYKWIKVAELSAWGFYIVKTKPKLLLITLCLTAAALYSSVLAIWQLLLQSSVGGLWWFLGERTFNISTAGIARFNLCLGPDYCREILRPYATFPHPNVLAGFITATMLILNQELRIKNQAFKKRIFLIILNSLYLTALFISASRSAIIFGVTIWFISVLIFRKKYSAFRLILNSLFLILVAGTIFISFSGAGESVVLRQQLNAAAISIWSQSPFFGVGFGNFLVELPRYVSAKTVFFLQPVHNIYLLVLSETGLLGFVIFAYLFIRKVLSIMYQVLREKQGDRTGPVLALLSLLLIGLVDHYPFTLQQGQIMMTLLVAMVIR